METLRPDKPSSKKEVELARREFSAYYETVRKGCPHAPAEPKRVFGLLMKVYRERYSRRVWLWQFLACTFDVLGEPAKRKRPAGLFETFDLSNYRGRLTPAKHFLNVLVKRLRARLARSLRPRSDQRRRPAWFQPFPWLHLSREWRLPWRSSWRFGPQRLLENLSDRPWPPGEEGRGQLQDVMREAFDCLNAEQRKVMWLTSWPHKSISARAIGRILDLDHKTVRKYRDTALRKLGRYFQDERERQGECLGTSLCKEGRNLSPNRLSPG